MVASMKVNLDRWVASEKGEINNIVLTEVTSMYKKRLIDDLLLEYKKSKFAILVEGAKATGKTSTCKELTEESFYLDQPIQREVIESNPQMVFESGKDILLDEWQRLPEIWEVVRRKIDEGTYQGSIFMTGSSPSLQPKIHSGSGRILRFKMRPLSIEERELDIPKIKLSNLLVGKIEDAFTHQTEITLDHYLDEIFNSGFPGIRLEPDRFRLRSIESYIDNIIHHDLLEQEIKVRKPLSMKAWLASYAAATATNANNSTIAEAAFSDGEGAVSAKTIQSYKEILQGIGVIEQVPAWLPFGSLFSNLGKTPKHFLVDPAIAVSLLHVTKKNLLQGRRLPKTVGKLNKTFLGQLFESLVYQSLATYTDINEAHLSHLRLRGGEKEIDFIVQKEDTIVAIEVKSKAKIDGKDVANLHWFEQKIKGEYDVVKVVIHAGPYAYKRPDGVIVVPLALLGC